MLYSYQKKPQNTQEHSQIKIAVLLIILALLFIFFHSYRKNPSKFEQFFLNSANKERQPRQNSDAKVTKIFLEEIAKLDGHWAIAVKDLKTDKTYFYNENDRFSSASLFKLAVMWSAFAAIEKGRMHEDDQLGAYSVKSALEAMITISDNESAILLAEKIGWVNIQSQLEKEKIIGFDLTSENSPYTTATATLNLLERIYHNTAVSNNASKQMKDLLLAQKINDRIPKYLPEEVKVAHKTGEIDSFKHDAGMVFGQKSHYIFVFLSETSSPQDAAETIATLSKKIYDALEEK